jgi:hypothetical protein
MLCNPWIAGVIGGILGLTVVWDGPHTTTGEQNEFKKER